MHNAFVLCSMREPHAILYEAFDMLNCTLPNLLLIFSFFMLWSVMGIKMFLAPLLQLFSITSIKQSKSISRQLETLSKAPPTAHIDSFTCITLSSSILAIWYQAGYCWIWVLKCWSMLYQIRCLAPYHVVRPFQN